MALHVRLDKELEKTFTELARREGVTRSDLLRQCLKEFLARKARSATPWEHGASDLRRLAGVGEPNLRAAALRALAALGETEAAEAEAPEVDIAETDEPEEDAADTEPAADD